MPSAPPPAPLSPKPNEKPPLHPPSLSPTNSSSKRGNGSFSRHSVSNKGHHSHQDSNMTADSFTSLSELLNKDDQAERGLLNSMESRRTTNSMEAGGNNYWRASCQGERPPLGGSVPLDQAAISALEYHRGYGTTGGSSIGSNSRRDSIRSAGSSQNSATKLADIARRMRQKASSSAASHASGTMVSTGSVGTSGTATSRHTRGASYSRAHMILDSIQEQPDSSDVFEGVGMGSNVNGDVADGESGGNSTTMELEQANSNTDRLLTGATIVEDLFDNSPPVPAAEPVYTEPYTATDEAAAGDEHEMMEEAPQGGDEFLPLIRKSSLNSYQKQTGMDASHGSSAQIPMGSPASGGRAPPNKSPNQLRRQNDAKKRKARMQIFIWTWCHPFQVFKRFMHLLWYQSFILSIAVPCFVTAWICYFWLENPHLNFLPGDASVSWWLNFVGQEVLVLEAARVWQWLFIDHLVLGTRIAVQCLGPLLTLVCIQARGYPFWMASWGFLDLIVLEGTNNIERAWYHFTGTVLSGDTGGKAILSSQIYVRLLLSMVLAGCATAVKRTAVAMYFGRRTFLEFRPRLEKLLKDVVLVSELAALAEEAEIAASEEEAMIQAKLAKDRDRPANKVKFIGDVTWTRNTPKSQRKPSRASGTGLPKGSNSGKPASSVDGSDSDDDDDDESEITTQHDIRSAADRNAFQHSEHGVLRIKELMDHWDEPVNKMDKSINASISDILRFRRALTFMDDDHPFGEPFGPASTRDEVITSAHDVYHRLLKLTPGRHKLSCEFYDMLCLEDDGDTVNPRKRKALRRLFRPDKNNDLSLLAFVQNCDSLFKKLRYFRANVGNASVIDHALESIVDGAFTFVLLLTLLSVMRINPWPLLVSISTLLVSISFAVGSSASKWFEGMLLVAVRRPYDLGDRIYMSDPNLIVCDGLWYCWFVEDINLFHTTVRYAGTNEIATINNGSVANMRIINGARSPNACVWWQFAYRPTLMEDGNVDKLKAALEEYAKENPRNWHSFSYFRVDEVHPELEKLVVTIGMNHRAAWQDLVRILEAKALIMTWLMEYSRKLGVIYDVLPQRELMYYAGSLKEGGVRQHRFQLHDAENITSDGFPVPFQKRDQGVEQVIPHASTSDSTFLQQLRHSHT